MKPIPLRIVTVTNDIETYPEFAKETLEFPNLVDYVEDDIEIFIVGEDENDFWCHHDFFLLGDIKRFVITEGNIEGNIE